MFRVSILRICCAVFCCSVNIDALQSPSSVEPAFPLWEARIVNFIQLDEAEVHKRGSYCLDGNMPGFYYQGPCTSGAPDMTYTEPGCNSTKWVLGLMGGGWCKDEQECARRTKTGLQGPAKPEVSGHALFVGEEWANFHRVIMTYCDGGLFAGDRAAPVVVTDPETNEKTTLYFRGRRILDHLLDTLSTKYGLSEATEVLLSGGSAGGLTTYMLADYIGSKMPASVHKFRAAPYSGFWTQPVGDYQGFDEMESAMRFPGYMVPVADGRNRTLVRVPEDTRGPALKRLETFKYMVEMHNMGDTFSDGCKKHAQAKWHCVFADVSYKFAKTPIFVMQAMDEFVVSQNETSTANLDDYHQCFLNLLSSGNEKDPGKKCSPSTINHFNEIVDNVVSSFQSSAKYQRPGEGGFITGCNLHTFYKKAQIFKYHTTVNNKEINMYEALTKWFSEEEGAEPTWYLPCHYSVSQPHHCTDCGPNPYKNSR